MFRKIVQLTLGGLIFLSYPIVAAYAGSCTVPYPIPSAPNNTCSTSDSVTITAIVQDSTVTFSGLAPSSSVITFKDSGIIVGNTTADPSGLFNKTVSSSAGSHDFSLYLTDTSGRSTPETLFPGVNLGSHTDTPLSNILLPATVELSKTQVNNGETSAFFGQGSPGSTVHVILNGNEVYSQAVTAGSDWQYTFNSGYVSGNNTVYAFLTRPSATASVNSFTLNLNVGSCRRSDLNCDGRVNLTDFSILLYYWDTTATMADTNYDGKVGLVDFSIMLFDWTD